MTGVCSRCAGLSGEVGRLAGRLEAAAADRDRLQSVVDSVARSVADSVGVDPEQTLFGALLEIEAAVRPVASPGLIPVDEYRTGRAL